MGVLNIRQEPSITTTVIPSTGSDNFAIPSDPLAFPIPNFNATSSDRPPAPKGISGIQVFLVALASVIAAVVLVLGITCLIIRIRRNHPDRQKKNEKLFPDAPVIVAKEGAVPTLAKPPATYQKLQKRAPPKLRHLQLHQYHQEKQLERKARDHHQQDPGENRSQRQMQQLEMAMSRSPSLLKPGAHSSYYSATPSSYYDQYERRESDGISFIQDYKKYASPTRKEKYVNEMPGDHTWISDLEQPSPPARAYDQVDEERLAHRNDQYNRYPRPSYN